jgi:hypothetical protein
LSDRTETERRFPWGLCALLGAVGWIIATVALGLPAAMFFLAPVAGVILGWIIGGIVFLVVNPSE